MDRLAIVLVTFGALVLLLAGMAGIRLVGSALRRQDRWTDAGGLITLGVFFVVTVAIVFALTAGNVAAGLPAPIPPLR